MKPTWQVLHATIKLLRLRLRLWWNSIKHSNWRRRIAYAFAGLGMLVFAGFLAFASWSILAFINSPRLSETLQQIGLDASVGDLLMQVPVLFSVGAFLAGVFTSFGVLLQSLYLSGDMEFLLAAPLPPRAVFASKLLQAILPSLLMLGLFSGPALVGLGLSQGFHPLYYVLTPLTLILLVVSGAGLSALLVMAVVRLVPPRRAAEVLGLLGGLIGVLCSQSGQVANRFDLSPGQVTGALTSLERLAAAWNPLAWPGLALSEIGQRHWGMGSAFTGLTLAASAGLLAASLATAERMYFSGWSRVQTGTTARRPRPGARSSSADNRRTEIFKVLPAPVRALLAKDARMYRRDLRNLSQLVTPILFAVIWTLTLGRSRNDPGLPEAAQAVIRLGTVGIALFVGWMFAMRFAMGGLSSEGRQWWILKSAPLRSRHLLLAKFLVAVIPSAGLSLLYLFATALFRPVSASTLLYQALAVLVITGAECSLLLSFGIWTARFDWDNPREVSGGLGGCLGTLATMAFLGLATALFIGFPVLGELLGWPTVASLGVGLTSGIVLCGLIGTLPLWLAMRRIPQLGEINK